MALPDILRFQNRVYTLHAPLLNAAGTISFMPASRGKIVKATLTSHGTITGSSALTMSISGTAVTAAAVTLPAGAAGSTGTVEPTALNVFASTDYITLTWASGITGAFAGTWVVTIREF